VASLISNLKLAKTALIHKRTFHYHKRSLRTNIVILRVEFILSIIQSKIVYSRSKEIMVKVYKLLI